MHAILHSLQPLFRAGAVTMVWFLGVALALWLKTGDFEVVAPGINMVFAVAVTCFWFGDMVSGAHGSS